MARRRRFAVLLVLLTTAMLLPAGAASAAKPPPCSALVKESTLKRAFGLGTARVYREAELPKFQTDAEGDVVFTCAWEVFDAGHRKAGAFIDVESLQVKALPAKQPASIPFKNFSAKEGSGLYPVPRYGAEHAGGYIAPDPELTNVLAGWWSVELGRRVALQASWPHHTKQLKGILNKLGAAVVPRDVLRAPF
jgi:hypothetical protein